MENQKNQTQQIILNNGLILGFVSILLSVSIYALGLIYEMKILFLTLLISLIIFIVFIVVGIKQFKKINSGFLSLSESIKIGLGIALISGIMSITYNIIFTTFLEPEYEKNMILVSEQWTYETFNLPDEAFEKLQEENREKIENFEVNHFTNIAKGLSFSLFSGLIISLIAGLFMRKSQENPYTN